MTRASHTAPRVLCFSLALLLAAAAWAAALAQDQVRTRGWAHDSFGRVVFDWPRQVGYEAAVENGDAVVRFAAPMATDLSRAAALLAPYVIGARMEEGGRVARFELAGPSRITSFRNDNSIVVDIRPAGGGDAPLLGVRVGEHSGYTRVVFDWTEPVDYRVDRQGDTVRVRFGRPARIDVDRLAASLPDGFGRPQVFREGEATVVALAVPEGAGIRDLRAGSRVAVDVLDDAVEQPRPPEATVADAAQATPPEDAAASEPAPGPEPAPLPEPAAAPSASEPAQTEPQETAPPAGARAEDAGPVPLIPLPAASDARADPVEDEEAVADAVRDESGRIPEPEAVDRQAEVSDDPARGEEPVDPQILADERVTEEAVRLGMVQFARDETGRRIGELGPAPVSFSFEWPEEVGAAVFRRGDHIWIVFDRRAPIDLAPLRQEGAPLLDRIEQLPVGGATVLRMRARPEVNPDVRLEGFNWVVDFRMQPMPPRQQAEIVAEADADNGPRLIFPSAAPGGALALIDPDVGDELAVGTFREAGFGVEGVRNYPEFRILESAQGIVVEPLADDVLFDRSFNGFAISSTEGLHISAVSPGAPVSIAGAYSARRLFDFEGWMRGGPGAFRDAESALFRAVVEVPEAKRNDARTELARFYLARDMGAEAIGVLRAVEGEDPDYFNNPETKALRAVAAFLTRRFEAARQDLADPRFDGFAEAALWRGAVLAELGEWRLAADHFRAGDSILRNYPFPLKGRLALLRVEAALATRDIRAASAWLDDLDRDRDRLRRGQQGDLSYHQGRVAMTRNDLERARELWSSLAKGVDLKNAARAEYALVNMERRQSEIDDAEVLERLERLRYRWRGDRFELSVLRRLGQIYIETGDYFNGLSSWRTAVTYFSETPEAQELAQEMTELFRRLYIDGEADRMPPLRALALYDEFRELTPAGDDGDLLIEKLADRLVAVDLLGRAAALLDHQVQFRLQGEDRARIGAKLAFIRLLDNDPVGAVNALNRTNFPQLEREIEDDRRRLRAKAMFELDRDDEAVKLLAGDVSREADILRQDIYRKAENWTEAAKVLQRLSGDPPGEDAAIPDNRARHVVNWAVALKLDRDEPGLAQVRRLYGPAMNVSAYRDVFNYIVAPAAEGGASLTASLQQLSGGDGFNAFMENYRERMLSAVLGDDEPPRVTTGATSMPQG